MISEEPDELKHGLIIFMNEEMNRVAKEKSLKQKKLKPAQK